MPHDPRAGLLRSLARLIAQISSQSILKIAVDGVDGAGKTFLADELAAHLRDTGRDVIRASVDGFHHPRSIRYRQGRDSPRGFYLDSYDYEGLRRSLLDPLSEGGSGRYRTAIFDCSRDQPLCADPKSASPDSILLFDGIFLHRPELRDYWDLSVYLDVDFSVSIPRGAQRGQGFGSPDPRAESNARYIQGQELYFKECQPKALATLVIDNNDLSAPWVSGGTLARAKGDASWQRDSSR